MIHFDIDEKIKQTEEENEILREELRKLLEDEDELD